MPRLLFLGTWLVVIQAVGGLYSASTGTPELTKNGLGNLAAGEAAPGFTIVNPYKGADGNGPYANWYAASTHTHSPASGAGSTIPQLFSDGAAIGLVLVPVNDKNTVSVDPGSHPGQYYWPGYEDVTAIQHMLCLGCTFWPGPRTSNQDAIDKMHAQGGLAILAHPNWVNSWTPENIAGLVGFDGVEVTNGQGYLGWNVWDAALATGRQVLGTGGNDLYGRGYAELIYINSPSGSMSDLLANLRLGNFYGSTACTTTAQGCNPGHAFALRVSQSGNTITVNNRYSESDPTPVFPNWVTWYCGYPNPGTVCGSGPSYTITGNEIYVRALWGGPVSGPMRAWTQPIYVVSTGTIAAPVITSPVTAAATVGASFTYTIAATNNPTSYSASGLPPGLNLNTSTGVVLGTPQSTGTFSVTLRAVNAGGTGTATLALTVAPVATGAVNVASRANGASAVASSQYVNGQFPAASTITGNRSGAGWGSGTGGWNDDSVNVYSDWLEVDFAGPRNITEVDVFTVQDAFAAPVTPTLGMTFSLYGITDFDIEYDSAGSWVDVPGGHITGNNFVWRQLTFAPTLTSRIRVRVNASLSSYSRIVDVEAYEASPSATSAATFVTMDTTTQGNWKGVYGTEGFAINSDGVSYPSYAQVSLSGSALTYVWPSASIDGRALQQSVGSGRIASTWFAPVGFSVDVNLASGGSHRVELYFEDVDGWNGPRSETVEVRDAETGAVLASRSLSNFGGGQYMVWTLTGHVVINIANAMPGSNALLNGMFFR